MNILVLDLLSLHNWLDFQLGLSIRITCLRARAKIKLIALHLSNHEICAGLFVRELLLGAAVTLKNYGGRFPSLERLDAYYRVTGNGPVAQNYEKKERARRLLWNHTVTAREARQQSSASSKNRARE